MPTKKKTTTGKSDNLVSELTRRSSAQKEQMPITEGMVYIEKGVTKHLGDNNYATVTIGITVPINATDEHIRDAKKTIQRTNVAVDKLLEDEVNDLFN